MGLEEARAAKALKNESAYQAWRGFLTKERVLHQAILTARNEGKDTTELRKVWAAAWRDAPPYASKWDD